MLKNVLHIILERLQHLWHILLDKDILTFLLFVGMAYLLWMGRTMASQRDISVNIPIHYADIPPEACFDMPLPPSLHVTVQDKGRAIMRLKKDKPTLLLNLDSYMTSRNGNITISSGQLRKIVTQILPTTMNVIDCSPETLHFSYTIQKRKDIPVVLKGQWTLASQYQLDKEPIVQPATISVYGSDNDLCDLSRLTTEFFSLSNLRDSTSVRVSVEHPKDVRILTDSVIITFIPEQFTEKRFILPIRPISNLKNGTLHIFPNEAEVIARVGIKDFQHLSQDDFQVLCPYPDEQDSLLTLEVKCQNSAVTQVRVTPPIVEFLLERD